MTPCQQQVRSLQNHLRLMVVIAWGSLSFNVVLAMALAVAWVRGGI